MRQEFSLDTSSQQSQDIRPRPYIFADRESQITRDIDLRSMINTLLEESLGAYEVADVVAYRCQAGSERLNLLAAILEGEMALNSQTSSADERFPPSTIDLPFSNDTYWSRDASIRLPGGVVDTIPPWLGGWHQHRGHQACFWSVLLAGSQPVGLLGVAFRKQSATSDVPSSVNQDLRRSLTLVFRMAAASDIATKLVVEAAVAKERQRIAEDLHDTLAYCFTAVLVQLEAAKELFLTKPELTLDCLDRASLVAKQALQQTRQTVLQVENKQHKPLVGRLRGLIAECENGVQPTFLFTLEGTPRPLAGETERQLVCICQEALANARRCANAKKISMSLTFDLRDLKLLIEDDGIGFNTGQVNGMGFGLHSMKKRAERIGASLTVRSSQGCGTSVSLCLDTVRATRALEDTSCVAS